MKTYRALILAEIYGSGIDNERAAQVRDNLFAALRDIRRTTIFSRHLPNVMLEVLARMDRNRNRHITVDEVRAYLGRL